MLNFGGKLEFSLNIIAFLAFMDAKLKVQKKMVPFSQFTKQIKGNIPSQLKMLAESRK